MTLAIRFSLLMTLTLISSAQKCQNGERDLKSYQALGPKNLVAAPSDVVKVRSFLWNHWHGQKLATVLTYRATKEGMPVTERLFIEPDRNGKWGVQVEIARGNWEAHGASSTCYRVYQLVREQVGKDGVVKRELAPDEAANPSSYRIALLDQKGKEMVVY